MAGYPGLLLPWQNCGSVNPWYAFLVISHQILFVRHAETTYSNVYPDITEEGARQLRLTARELHPHIVANPENTLTIIASPAMRAQGSAGVLAEALGYSDEIITEPLLSDMAYADWPKAREIFELCRTGGGRVEDVYDSDERFEDTSIFEPRSSVRRRFYRYMKQCHDSLIHTSAPQCIVAVSHFEVLNHFLRELWPDAPWLRWATSFRITFERPHSSQDVVTTVTYAGKSFNSSPRTLFKFDQVLEFAPA